MSGPSYVEVKSVVNELRNMAKERWGDVSVSVKTLHHENGEFSVKVFHTFHVQEPRPGLRLACRAVLHHDTFRDQTVERVTRHEMQRTEVYDEVELSHE